MSVGERAERHRRFQGTRGKKPRYVNQRKREIEKSARHVTRDTGFLIRTARGERRLKGTKTALARRDYTSCRFW